MDGNQFWNVLLWIVAAVATGVIGNAGYAGLGAVIRSTRAWLAARQAPPTQSDLQFVERLASDNQRLLIFLGGIVLGTLVMMCTSGILLIWALSDSSQNKMLYFSPGLGLAIALYFCSLGFKYLGKASERLNQRDQEILARTN